MDRYDKTSLLGVSAAAAAHSREEAKPHVRVNESGSGLRS
jgi:hypothetical protein